jgi:transcription elongation factor GreA
MDRIHLTRQGYDKLLKELEELKTVKRRKLSDEIAKARAHGDISENAEYAAAKEAQGLNEKRIAELEDKLSRAEIIDSLRLASDQALIGATVKVKDLGSGEEESFMLVSESEADYSQGKISVTSPIGKALLGHKVKDVVEIRVPAGILKYKILAITR